MPPKSATKHRTPKKESSKDHANWQSGDGSTLTCDTEGTFLEVGTSLQGILRLADEGVVPKAGPKQDHYVFLHPKTMEALQVSIGDNVILSSSSQAGAKKVVCAAWPSASLRLTDVAVWMPSLRSLSLSPSDFVGVCGMTSELRLAKRMTLTTSQEVSTAFDGVFKRYLSRRLDRRLFYLQNCVDVPFCGEDFTFTVSDVVMAREGALPASVPSTPTSTAAPALPLTPTHSTPPHLSPVVGLGAALAGSPSAACNYGDPASQSALAAGMSAMSLKEQALGTPNRAGGEGESDGQPVDVSDGPVVISATETEIVIVAPSKQTASQLSLDVTCDDIGGLHSQIVRLRRFVDRLIESPDIMAAPVLSPYRGVLVHGPAGTGKKLLIRAVLGELKLPHVYVKGDDVLKSTSSESALSDAFSKAKKLPKCVLVIDQLDRLCPVVTRDTREAECSTRSQILSLFDELNTTPSSIMILATSRHKDSVCSSMRMSGRFAVDVEATAPKASEREEILRVLLRDTNHQLSEEDVKSFAGRTHGYVGDDLFKVCQAADHYCRHRNAAIAVDSDLLSTAVGLTLDDFEQGLGEVQPSMMGITLEVPKVCWEDIGGLSEIKATLRRKVEWPLKYPERFVKFGRARPRGALLYGPPGCSKTMIAQALATESGLNFLSVKGPELFSKYVGESEKAVREVFRRARDAAPSIVFFDEIDALGVKRDSDGHSSHVSDRVVTQLLTEMDGVEGLGHVVVIAATNRPDTMDKALLRPGRFDSLIYVPLPDANTRKEIFKVCFRNMPVEESVQADGFLQTLVDKTEGFSGCEIVLGVNNATDLAMCEEDCECVSGAHFDAALAEVMPLTTSTDVLMYEAYAAKRSQGRSSSSGLDAALAEVKPQTTSTDVLMYEAYAAKRSQGRSSSSGWSGFGRTTILAIIFVSSSFFVFRSCRILVGSSAV